MHSAQLSCTLNLDFASAASCHATLNWSLAAAAAAAAEKAASDPFPAQGPQGLPVRPRQPFSTVPGDDR